MVTFAASVVTLFAFVIGCGSGDAEPAPVPIADRSPFLGINGDRLIYPLGD